VLALCDATNDEVLLRNACHYFRDCPSASALPMLQKLFASGTKMFGLVKGVSTRTRAAAVEAALRISDPQAQQIVDKAVKDKSGTVRRAATSPPPGNTGRRAP
jgi:hypothetical protein